ncbi:MAG: hypothetical protein AAF085_13740 [Planctomycetota bacterium]
MRFRVINMLLCLLLIAACSAEDDNSMSASNAVPDRTPPSKSTTDYFPDLIFSDTPDHHEFVVDWYSKHLRAMDEPSLYDRSQDSEAHQYRFLWLPTWGRPVAVRLELSSDGTGLVKSTILDGSGGYEPGNIKSETTATINAEKVKSLLEDIESIKYWSMPTRDDRIGTDGEQYILEAIKGGRHHIVDRWSPEDGDSFAEVCQQLIKLAGIKTPVK